VREAIRAYLLSIKGQQAIRDEIARVRSEAQIELVRAL